MTVNAIALINENIDDKKLAFNDKKRPRLEVTLVRLAKNGIKVNGKELAEITYVQNATGACDYIIHLQSDNVEKLMKAINVIRQIDQVYETETHIGEVLYKKK